jgi:hypothetical protein
MWGWSGAQTIPTTSPKTRGFARCAKTSSAQLAQKVVGTAEAAYGSRAHVELLLTQGCRYVMALPRTWKLAHGKVHKARVPHRPRWQ